MRPSKKSHDAQSASLHSFFLSLSLPTDFIKVDVAASRYCILATRDASSRSRAQLTLQRSTAYMEQPSCLYVCVVSIRYNSGLTCLLLYCVPNPFKMEQQHQLI